MSGTDTPPSTTSSPRVARRALTMSLSALIAVAAPVGLVAATSGGPDLADASERTDGPGTTVIEQIQALGESTPIAFRALEEAVPAEPAPAPTTTTTVPPTTTTAPPPPPPPPPPAPAPQPVASGTGYADPANPAAWDRLAQCEAGGNWHINTGNGYYGGLQFSLSSWQAVGGPGYPHEQSRETQIAMGQRLHAHGGWSHWPACSLKLGYR
jgi:hypothetical protein